MYWDVLEVKPIAPRELFVQFADGLSGVVVIDTSFCTGVFEPLRDDQWVARAQVNNGAVVWSNGLDLAPDTMYHEIKRNINHRYMLRREKQNREQKNASQAI